VINYEKRRNNQNIKGGVKFGVMPICVRNPLIIEILRLSAKTNMEE
jgi:hypothetical protein